MTIETIDRFAARHGMFPPGGLVLCALSGGADSMCLLDVLLQLSHTKDFQVAAAHFNHQLRGGDSEQDMAFVEEYCEDNGVSLCTGRGDVRARAQKEGRGIEETARKMRYAFLQNAADEIGAARIATAHNADDNAETVLFNLARGTGPAGLCGIPPVRGGIIRPLLGTPRSEIEQYLASRGIPHIEDKTNADLRYTRNRLRHTVVPVLREINPRFSDAVGAASALLRADSEYLERLADGPVSAARPAYGGTALPAELVAGLPAPVASRVVRRMIDGMGKGMRDIGLAHVDSVLELAGGGGPSDAVSLPGGIVACRVYADLVFVRGGLKPRSFETKELKIGRKTRIPELNIVILCEVTAVIDRTDVDLTGLPNAFFVDPALISGPLIVRPRRTGDRITLPGAAGSRSLKKLFIDKKIPAFLRGCVPVIADEKGVVAVNGMGVDKTYLAQPGAGALAIKIVEDNDEQRYEK